MGSVTVRVRSLVWFATGIVLALLATVLVTEAWRADAAPGDTDTTFAPVTPCRLIDTRQPGQTTFGANETRTLDAHDTNGDCTIPADAVGLSMNVTADGASVAGTYLTIWEDSVAMPTASSLNPAPGPPTPNAVTVPLSPAGRFNVYNFVGTVDVIIDINGYHTKASLVELAARLAELEKAQPFVLSDSTEGDVELTDVSETIISVQLTAPVEGQVSIVAAANVDHVGLLGADVDCDINTATSGKGMELWFERDQVSNSGNVAGTRVFDLAASAAETYRLQCREAGDGGILDQATLTAIFTPAP